MLRLFRKDFAFGSCEESFDVLAVADDYHQRYCDSGGEQRP